MRGVWKDFGSALRLQTLHIPIEIEAYEDFIGNLGQDN